MKLIPVAQELLGDTVDLLYQRLKIIEIEGYHYPPSSVWWKPINNVRTKIVNPKGTGSVTTGSVVQGSTGFPVAPDISTISQGGTKSSSRPKQVEDLSVFRSTVPSSAGTHYPAHVPSLSSIGISDTGDSIPVSTSTIPTSTTEISAGTSQGTSGGTGTSGGFGTSGGAGISKATPKGSGTSNPVKMSRNNDTIGSGNAVTIISSGGGGSAVTLQPDDSSVTSGSSSGGTMSAGTYTVPVDTSGTGSITGNIGFPDVSVGSGTSVTLVFGDNDPEDSTVFTDTQQGSPYTYDPRENIVIHDGPKTSADSDTYITVYPIPYYPAGHDQAYTRNVTGTFMTNDEAQIGSYVTESSDSFEDLPDLFPSTTNIELSVDTPRTLVQIATDSYRRDQLDLTTFYLQSLKVILQTYMAPLLTLVAESGIGSLD